MKKQFLLLGVFVVFLSLSYLITSGYLTLGTKLPAAEEQPLKKLGVGASAPDFSLTTLDKKNFKLSEMKGKNVILFTFSPWCGSCIEEGRALTKIRKEYQKEVEIIAVDVIASDDESALESYLKVGQIDIPLSLDTDEVTQKYGIDNLEYTFIINQAGVVVYKDDRFTDFNTYKKELDKLI